MNFLINYTDAEGNLVAIIVRAPDQQLARFYIIDHLGGKNLSVESITDEERTSDEHQNKGHISVEDDGAGGVRLVGDTSREETDEDLRRQREAQGDLRNAAFTRYLRESDRPTSGVLGRSLRERSRGVQDVFTVAGGLGSADPSVRPVIGFDPTNTSFTDFLRSQGAETPGTLSNISQLANRTFSQLAQGRGGEAVSAFSNPEDAFGRAQLRGLVGEAARSQFSPFFSANVLPQLLPGLERQWNEQLLTSGVGQPTFAAFLRERLGF